MKKLMTLALLAATVLAGCDKIKDAASIDFTVDGVRFEFSADVAEGYAAEAEVRTAAVAYAGEALNSFEVTRTVSLSEIGSSNLTEYRNTIDKVKANSSLLKVTVTPPVNYTVTGLKIEAAGVSGSPLTIPSLIVGGTFTPPANMNAFTEAFVMKLVTAGSVQVTVSGLTDAPAGTTIKISYENDLLFTAGLL